MGRRLLQQLSDNSKNNTGILQALLWDFNFSGISQPL
jgi:hypothetical protein